jgi:hypothetical protein
MNKKAIIWGLVIIGASVGGYFIYRKIRTSSNSAEKNNRKIKVLGNKNVVPTLEQGDDINNDSEN